MPVMSLCSLPPELKLKIISYLKPVPTPPHPVYSTATALWQSQSYLLPKTQSALTQLSQTNSQWKAVCRIAIWEQVNLEGVTLEVLLDFVTMLHSSTSPIQGVKSYIKAIHIPSKPYVYFAFPLSPNSVARQISDMDRLPLNPFPSVTPGSQLMTGERHRTEWITSCYRRLLSLLISPTLTPNLSSLSISKSWDHDPFVDFRLIISANAHKSLRTLSLDVRLLRRQSSVLAHFIPEFTGLEELALAGDSDNGTSDTIRLLDAIASLSNLSVLRLADLGLALLGLENRTQFGCINLRRLDLLLPYAHYNLHTGSVLVAWLRQWSLSLVSLYIRTEETYDTLSLPPPLSKIIASFPNLLTMEVEFTPRYHGHVVHSLVPVPYHFPLPILTPFLESLVIYLHQDYHLSLDNFILPATPKKKLKLICASVPERSIQKGFENLVEADIRVDWVARWIAPEKMPTPLNGGRRRRGFHKEDGDFRRDMTDAVSKNGVWTSLRKLLSWKR